MESHGQFHIMMEGSLILAPAVRLVVTQCISKLSDGALLLYGGGADRG